MVELVDTPGLEPGAVRCAGSSPVLGKNDLIDTKRKKVQKSIENRCQICIYQLAIHSGIAQSVEQMTVNHWVVGSSPSPGELINIFILILNLKRCLSQNQQRNQQRELWYYAREILILNSE